MEGARGRNLFVDTETNAGKINDGRGLCMGVSFAYKERTSGEVVGRYFPFYHQFGSNYGRDVLEEVRDIIQTAPSFTAHNAKFDLESLRTIGIEYSGPWNCTMVWAHLLNENWPRSKSLDSCCAYYLGDGFQKRVSDQLSFYQDKKHPERWALIPADLMDEYAKYDAINGFHLAQALWPKLRAEGIV